MWCLPFMKTFEFRNVCYVFINRRDNLENFLCFSGCHFHYAKALFNKVVKAGLKSYYSKAKKNLIKSKKDKKLLKNSKKSIAFSTFIRASIGMAYVPLDKLEHAHKILKQLGKELKGRKIKEFAKKFLYYYDKTWMNGHYERHEWNMHMHRGITSNNISEGYNSKINNHKDLKANPNPYLLAAFIKDQFKVAENKTLSSDQGNPNDRAQASKFRRLKERKEAIMVSMDGIHGDWKTYIIAIGEAAIDLDVRINEGADDFDPEEKDKFDSDEALLEVSSDSNPDFTIICGKDLRNARAKQARKKVSFNHTLNLSHYDLSVQENPVESVNEIVEDSYQKDNSQDFDFTLKVKASKNSKDQKKPADIPVKTVKPTKKSKDPKKPVDIPVKTVKPPKKSKEPKKPVNKAKSKPLLSLAQGKIHQLNRLRDINFVVSPSQPDTVGDGNCFLYSILDQLR